MIPVIVEHLVCAMHFIHILALLTTNQISNYYPSSTVAKSASGRSQVSYQGSEVSMPVSGSLEFVLKSS